MSRHTHNVLVLSEHAAWDNAHLTFDDEAMDAIRRDALSPSTSKAMSGCAAKWAASRLLPRGTDPFSHAELGDSVHAIFEDFYAVEPAALRVRSRALLLLEALRDKKWPGLDDATRAKAIDWQGQVYARMQGLWDVEDPRQVQVLSVEAGFAATTMVRDVPFIGYMDRVDRVDDGIRVNDYKTGRVPKDIGKWGDDHGDQMRLYAEAYRVEHGVMPVEANLIYTTHGKSRSVPLSRPAMSKTLAAWTRSWTTLKTHEANGTFPTKPGPLCGWCPLVNACPVAKAEGKVDRTGVALPAAALPIPVTTPLREEIAAYHDDFLDYGEPPVHEPDLSAHVPDALEPTEGTIMTDHKFSEDKSWNPESTDLGDGLFSQRPLLNANSYAAQAVFGLASFAYKEISAAGVPLSGNVLPLAQTLLHIVQTVQNEQMGSARLSDGLNTRLRGALSSYVTANPVPFGQDAATWETWVANGIKHVRSIANCALSLYHDVPVATPWVALAAAPKPQAVAG